MVVDVVDITVVSPPVVVVIDVAERVMEEDSVEVPVMFNFSSSSVFIVLTWNWKASSLRSSIEVQLWTSWSIICRNKLFKLGWLVSYA